LSGWISKRRSVRKKRSFGRFALFNKKESAIRYKSDSVTGTGFLPAAGIRMRATTTPTKTMITYIKTAVAALGFLAIGFMASSCADSQTSGTHQMGPPGKSRTMSDEEMPTRAH
jgi:hypothetical protein